MDRSAITRNAKGCEEKNSKKPELWNIDGTEMDWNAKYKTGGQMWYVQSRAKEIHASEKEISGYPINEIALKSKRIFFKERKKEEETGKEEEIKEKTIISGADDKSVKEAKLPSSSYVVPAPSAANDESKKTETADGAGSILKNMRKIMCW